jgi:SET domain
VRGCPHGRGVFALRDFDEGSMIAVVIGGEFVERPMSSSRYALRIGEHLYWDEIPAGEPGFWSNFLDHRSDANCKFVDFDRRLPGAKLVATQRIKSGDELFLNYREYHPTNPAF